MSDDVKKSGELKERMARKQKNKKIADSNQQSSPTVCLGKEILGKRKYDLPLDSE